jgi:hypothetical protein
MCIAEARRMGIECASSNLYVANLFGRRSRHPEKLNSLSYDEAVVEGNDGLLALMAGDVELVVAAWGNANGIRASWYRRRVTEVVDLLGQDRLTSFGTTAHGQPRHCYSWRFGRQTLQEWQIDQVRW